MKALNKFNQPALDQALAKATMYKANKVADQAIVWESIAKQLAASVTKI